MGTRQTGCFPRSAISRAVIAHMQAALPMIPPEAHIWTTTCHNLAECRLSDLQAFWAESQSRSLAPSSLGPDWGSQRNRSQLLASLGMQRAAGNSKRGLDHLIKPGMGKDRHVLLATRARNPLSPPLRPTQTWFLQPDSQPTGENCCPITEDLLRTP